MMMRTNMTRKKDDNDSGNGNDNDDNDNDNDGKEKEKEPEEDDEEQDHGLPSVVMGKPQDKRNFIIAQSIALSNINCFCLIFQIKCSGPTST